ncbi:5'-Nucleotidase domain protein [Ignavibacterium album JCM 16511]|uniref:5'-Nucleotidase domain protein n=1 Tax=Ignavibacterium album (strain DSM 19864 / JCM 16511 / NBRC 101810 / Mat9-16) TaxID=945713 RepID=I0AP05_IGNAJ|nr:T9SS type A sorting domain-containing protein [Ignavibacterium album]AFH50712.1 5'-Nucleotidase domain protein [Ignavibacterium album JCM 16511]
MKTNKILIVIFFLLLIIENNAQNTYNVQPGIKNNQIVLQIVNTSETEISLPKPLQRRGIKNLTFRDVSKETITLKPKEEKEIKYIFDVNYDADISKQDTIEFLITDNKTIHLTKQFILIYTQPKEFKLEQNYPNPFNPTTRIRYSIPNVGTGLALSTLKVYDILGNEVVTLVNEEKPAGYYEIEFNATELSSGVYFYRLQSGNFTQTKKMILMR